MANAEATRTIQNISDAYLDATEEAMVDLDQRMAEMMKDPGHPGVLLNGLTAHSHMSMIVGAASSSIKSVVETSKGILSKF
ncbi:hypothetical protein NUH87_30980 [Pseudomonas batumici]|uniref:hypothetical protein n=1 Tax=Pseudomonas batumici TaxID=226910 RepID=UPI0030D0E0D3